jgi:hypothetical protein
LQLQHWRDDNTGLRYTIRPLVSCVRRGRAAGLQPTTSSYATEKPVRPGEPFQRDLSKKVAVR